MKSKDAPIWKARNFWSETNFFLHAWVMLICQKSHLQSFSMSSPVDVLKNMWSPRPCWHICCDNIHLCAFRLELNITLSDSKRRLHKHAKSASRTCKSTVVRSRRSQIALQCRSVLGQEKNKKKKPGVRALQLFIQNFKRFFTSQISSSYYRHCIILSEGRRTCSWIHAAEARFLPDFAPVLCLL